MLEMPCVVSFKVNDNCHFRVYHHFDHPAHRVQFNPFGNLDSLKRFIIQMHLNP